MYYRKRNVCIDRQLSYNIHLTACKNIDIFYNSLVEHVIKDRTTLIVTTKTVADLYLYSFYEKINKYNKKNSFIIIDCNETRKNIDQVLAICKKSLQVGLNREGLLIGIGGGVCTDIATLAASMIRRGVNYIKIPTTLIGQIDAAIGIKGAINFENKKNYLGCFYPPESSIIFPSFLKTLHNNHITEGLSEIIKVAITSDEYLFKLLEENFDLLLSSKFQEPITVSNSIIWRSINGLLDQIESNLYENFTYRRVADFGHTFSPMIESYSGYSIHHGIAVAMDIIFSSIIANKIGELNDNDFKNILNLFRNIKLPCWPEFFNVPFCQEALKEAALHRGGRASLVIPTKIGGSKFIDSLSDEILEHSISFFKKYDYK